MISYSWQTLLLCAVKRFFEISRSQRAEARQIDGPYTIVSEFGSCRQSPVADMQKSLSSTDTY